MTQDHDQAIDYDDIPGYEVGLIIAIGWFACLMLIFAIGVVSSYKTAIEAAFGGGFVMFGVLVFQKWWKGGFADGI